MSNNMKFLRIQGLQILMNAAAIATDGAGPSQVQVSPRAERNRMLPELGNKHYLTSDGWIKAVQEERSRRELAEKIKKQKADHRKAEQARKREERELMEAARKRRKDERVAQKNAEVEWEVGTRRLRNLLYGVRRPHISLSQPREFNMATYEMRKKRYMLLKSQREGASD